MKYEVLLFFYELSCDYVSIELHLRPSQIVMMEIFAKIVNG